MTGTEKSTARPSPQSGFEIELIPYPDCIEVQTVVHCFIHAFSRWISRTTFILRERHE